MPLKSAMLGRLELLELKMSHQCPASKLANLPGSQPGVLSHLINIQTITYAVGKVSEG